MKRKVILYVLALVLLIVGIVYWLIAKTPSHGDEFGGTTPPAINSEVETQEEKARRTLLGVWQDDYQGKRTMTLNEDGTGTMLVELSGLQAALFASKLRFDMKWSLDGKKLIKKTVGGEPGDRVNLILNTMGNTAEDTILELSHGRLLLLDMNRKTKYDWRRVKKDEPGKE